MSSPVSKKETLNFLRQEPLGTIATTDKRGVVKLSAVYFFVNNDFSFHFVTKTNTKKYKHLISGSKITLLACSEARLMSVEITGRPRVVHDSLEIVKVIEKFHTLAENQPVKYWMPPIAQISAGNYIVIETTPKRVLSRRFRIAEDDSVLPVEAVYTF